MTEDRSGARAAARERWRQLVRALGSVGNGARGGSRSGPHDGVRAVCRGVGSAERSGLSGGPLGGALRGVTLAAMVVTAAVVGSAPASRSAALTVPPGSLVRWEVADEGTCKAGTESFAPLAGACWFPVDLLASGPLWVTREVRGVRETRRLEVGPYPYAEQRVTIEDDSKVNPSAADLVRIEAEQKRVGKLWSARAERRFALPLQGPLSELPEGGRFGARRVFNGQPRNPHAGVDYAAKTGTVVTAAAAGRVVLAEEQFFAGNAVYIDHGDGLVTMYFHLSALSVRTGDAVTAGQPIGKVGATGRASGPHLHWAARWRGARVDPELLLHPEAAPQLR
jgi:Peptidase family M23